MKTQLTKNERKYKAKLIAEYGINKDQQKYIDTFVEDREYTYKELYDNVFLVDYLLYSYQGTLYSEQCVQVLNKKDRNCRIFRDSAVIPSLQER